MPRPVDVVVLKTDILDMYVNQRMSASQIARKIKEGLSIGQCVRRKDIVQLLKNESTFRSHSETMLTVYGNRHYELNCDCCKQPFRSKQPFAKWCKECVPDSKAWSRVRMYGITNEKLQVMLNKQDDSCALCKQRFSELKMHRNKDHTYVIDHDHSTGLVRGLLCSECNVTLGHIEKKPVDWISNMTNYLAKAVI